MTVQGLVDYVAMDIKAPLTVESYSRASGITIGKLLNEVKGTLKFLLDSFVDYEFRTTLVPTIHDEEDLKQISHDLQGCRKYVLQNFKGDVETLDPTFEKIIPFSQLDMDRFLQLTKKTLPKVLIR